MKKLVLLCALIALTQSVPQGYYKQEFQFKNSSSSYKNNQLESKNEDAGYFGKQGDLEGHAAPQIEQHNQHSEFVSPNVDGVGHSVTTYNDRDLSPDAERAFRDHNLYPGTNGQRSYSYSSTSGNGGYQGGRQYATQSNLNQLTQNLQYDMGLQVRDAIRSMQGQSSSSYGTQTQMRNEDMQYLESQLRANITRQLQEALNQKYGQESTRGASSYSVSSSSGTGYSPTANYDTNELNDLRQQMESNLMKQLRENARAMYSSSSSSSSSNSYSSYGSAAGSGTATGNRQVHRDSAEVDDLNQRTGSINANYRPVYTRPTYSTDDLQRPERISYGQQPVPASHTTSYGSSYGQATGSQRQSYGSSYDRNFPTLSSSNIVVNPSRTVTDVIHGVQTDLSEEIRKAITSYQAKYASSTYTLTDTRPDFQGTLENFRRDLKYNLTRKLEDELDRNYGRQEIRGEYVFSPNSRNNANYRTADLDSLKKQVEDNLINFLETSFRSYETNYQQSRSKYASQQRDYSHQSPQYTQSLTSDTAQNPNYVRYEPGPYPGNAYRRQSSYSASSSYSSGGDSQQPIVDSQLQQIKNQLQEDLNRQLQKAVYEQKGHSTYSTQSTGQVEQLLTDELKSNLTRRLQDTLNQHYGTQGVRDGQSYTISATGSYQPNANYRTEDLSALRQQLQDDLVRNLQEQLSQSNSHGSAYSSQSQYSASSSNYSPNRYQGSYGNSNSAYNNGFKSGSLQKYDHFGHQSSASQIGEDCA